MHALVPRGSVYGVCMGYIKMYPNQNYGVGWEYLQPEYLLMSESIHTMEVYIRSKKYSGGMGNHEYCNELMPRDKGYRGWRKAS